ncbi:MAG: hypothetical protein JWM98_1078, partial [Thermoleophilia bacterium]|nr:hypothetical protein [Thermoleophilia bacterium]
DSREHAVRNKGKYAAIGYVVSKVVVPVAKKQAKKAAKNKAKAVVTAPAGAVRRSPAKASVLIGTAVGALGWIVTRRRGRGPDAE